MYRINSNTKDNALTALGVAEGLGLGSIDNKARALGESCWRVDVSSIAKRLVYFLCVRLNTVGRSMEEEFVRQNSPAWKWKSLLPGVEEH